MYRAFCDKVNKARLDHLFSLLLEKTLAKPPGESDEVSSLNKLSDLVPGVQWLNLPLSVEVSGGDIFYLENGYMSMYSAVQYMLLLISLLQSTPDNLNLTGQYLTLIIRLQ